LEGTHQLEELVHAGDVGLQKWMARATRAREDAAVFEEFSSKRETNRMPTGKKLR